MATHNGILGKTPKVDLDEYPAVKRYLDQYWAQLAPRTDQGDTPYHLRSCAYWNDFMKPKIVYTDIMSRGEKEDFPAFAYDEKGHVLMNTSYFLSSDTEDLRYTLGVLNSKVGDFIIQHFVVQLGNSGYRLFSQYITSFPIVHHPPQEKPITDLVGQLLAAPTPEKERALNALVCEAYGLTDQEREYIEAL